MTRWRYIVDSLRHYWRLHLAVAAGVATATAVIVGALLVGDSMRGSLRDRALAGLGRVEAALIAEKPFRAELPQETLARFEADLASRLPPGTTAKRPAYEAQPLLMLRGSLVAGSGANARRATGLTVYGVPDEFWSLAGGSQSSGAAGPPDDYELAIGREIAAELDLADGDAVVLRLPTVDATPADSALGEKDDTVVARRLEAAIVDHAAAPMVRFALRPSQQTPHNVLVPLERLQKLLNLPGRANAAAFAASAPHPTAPASLSDDLAAALRPQLDDFGLAVEQIAGGERARGGYLRLAAQQLVLPPAIADLAEQLHGNAGAQPAVTFLANTIAVGERSIPYSTITGVDSTAALGPALSPQGEPIVLADDEIALNTWVAKALDAEVGDTVVVAYYLPETTHGALQEAKPVTFRLRAIVPLANAAGAPTAAADPAFAPELPGVTDQASIDDWRLPFELVEEVNQPDEDYWDARRTTPKAFVSHATAARLWGSRWGADSVVRIPLRDGVTAEGVAKELAAQLDPQSLGMTLLPARQLALDSATGTTPFDGLFLGFSLFLMASAVMLIVLLFRLGAEQRAAESGLLLATGVAPRGLRRLALGEGGMVAAAGALLGVAAGVAYARVMVYGLNHWWAAATNAPFLRLHVTPRSLTMGFVIGVVVALAAMAWAVRRLVKLPPRQLLAGDAQPAEERLPDQGRRSRVAWSAGAAALGLAVGARWLQGEAQAGAFFGSGALALTAALAAVRKTMRRPSAPLRRLTLEGLSVRNARRNPGRTQLSLGLAGVASFLIVALSAFRLAPTEQGTGGFALLATADLPLNYDLGAASGRESLGFSSRANRDLATVRIESCRVHDGEDASCLNLYQTTQPRVIGVPPSLAEDDRFGWGGTAELAAGASPWTLLAKGLGADDAGRAIVPMVLDRNTAMYSLKLYAVGDRLTLRDEFDRPRTFEVVGLLANSVLQGEVLIDEQAFQQLYPSVAGRRYFLIGPSDTNLAASDVATLLESQLEDYGFDAVDARARLADLMAVQNTYLSTFQSLGALGLLLGVVGLGVVQVRSVLERRGELALMRAAGFRRQRLARMVLTENFVLLGGGLAIGCLAALAAVLPHAWSQGAAVPWATLGKLLAGVAVAGVAAGWLAARQALRSPLLPALRGE